MDNVTIILLFILLVIIIIGVVLYFKFNYIFVNKNDKETLNTGFSFLNDDYLENYVRSINNDVI